MNHKIDYFFSFILPKFEINLINMLRQRFGNNHIFNSSENRIVNISSRFIIKLEMKFPYLVLYVIKTVITDKKTSYCLEMPCLNNADSYITIDR